MKLYFSNYYKSAGLTLIELMITLSVIAILVTIAAPSMTNLRHKSEVRGHIRDFHSAVSFARAQAVSRARNVTICASSDGETCLESTGDWNSGWIIFVERGEFNGKRDLDAFEEELIRVYAYEGNNSLNVYEPSSNKNLSAFSWDFRGFSAAAGADYSTRALAVVCDRSDITNNALGLMISSSGRAAPTVNSNSILSHDSKYEKDDGSVSSETELKCS